MIFIMIVMIIIIMIIIIIIIIFIIIIGTPSACNKYMESETEKTATLTEKLSKIAKTSPQNAHSCYTKGV